MLSGQITDMLVRGVSTMSLKKAQIPSLHYKCRTLPQAKYQTGPGEKEVIRPEVPDDKLSWAVAWPEYAPVSYTHPAVLKNPDWADPGEPTSLKWNQIDGKTDRRSHHGDYQIENGFPRNPVGRTGISGRGLLGKWGPNHAADPVVTRWQVDRNGKAVKNEKTGKRILEFVSIQRKDTGDWAIPGGMCDPGEKISATVKREFMEEALNSEEMKKEEIEHFRKILGEFFNNGKEIYRGYVDDPRNTDNSWMETVACLFHDDNGSTFEKIKLKAGDDAKNVKWIPIDSQLQLYASHQDFIRKAAESLNAHW